MKEIDVNQMADAVVRGYICKCINCVADANSVVKEPIRPNSKDMVRVSLKHVRKDFRKNQDGHWEDCK